MDSGGVGTRGYSADTLHSRTDMDDSVGSVRLCSGAKSDVALARASLGDSVHDLPRLSIVHGR